MSLGLSEEERLLAAAPRAEANADRFIGDLYTRLTQTPATAIWFTRPGVIDRLKPQQRRYLTELFSSPINWDYVERRLQIGVAHHRVRLTPRWYVATCAHFVCAHVDLLLSSAASSAEGTEQIIALTKKILFDAALVLDAYGMTLENAIRSGRTEPSETPAGHSTATDKASAATSPDGPPSSSLKHMRLSADDCAERRQFLGIDETAIRTLRELTPAIRTVLPQTLQDFYTTFRSWPETAKILPEDTVQRLLSQVSAYWLELAQSNFDRLYATSRTRIGVVHEQIGVSPQVYLIGLARQLESLLRATAQAHPQPALALTTLLRATFFDISFVLDAYMDARAASVLQSEGYATRLLACLTVGVAVVDHELRVRSVNPALLQLLGIEAGLVQHMHANDLIPDARIAQLLAQSTTERGRRETIQVRFGGRHLRVSAVPLVLPDHEHGAPNLALTVDDVTDLADVAPGLDQTEKRLADTVSAVDAVLWEAEAATWTITTVSSPVHALTGLRDVHFLGRPRTWLERIPEPDRERFIASCGKLELNCRLELTYRLLHASAGLKWVRTHVVRGGTTLADSVFRGISIDVTSAVQEQQQRLEAVGRVAAGVAHEFNGLLTVLTGNLWLLEQGAGAAERVEIRSASAAIARGAALTRQLQAFAQGMPMLLRPFALSGILTSLAAEIRQLAGADITVTIADQPEVGKCLLDLDQFRSGVMNLVRNARESMPHGGILRLATGIVPAREIFTAEETEPGGDFVEVTVTDSGGGMDEATRKHAVEPFFTTKPGGHGLGLSAVHGFMRQCKGHLVIESAVGQGTTIRLRFPRQPAPAPAAREDHASSRSRRILIIEDDTTLGAVLSRMLARRGHAVRIAVSTAEAQTEIAAEVPDLVLCDVMFEGEAMGAIFGRELVERHPHLAIIYMSGYTKDALHLRKDELFLSKPFTFDDLDTVLNKVFR